MADWINFKNQGVWNFTKQGDKWGYLNNERWSAQRDAQIFCGRPDINIPLDLTNEHIPCGHWHLKPEFPPTVLEFPVGRLFGWESLYDAPYAFGYDGDYKRMVKVDLASLTAIDYSVTIDPGWGVHPSGYVKGIEWLILDNCFQYLYMIFCSGSIMKIWKIDPDDLSIVDYCETVNLGYTSLSAGTADMQYIYVNNGSISVLVISTNLSYPEDIPKIVTPSPQGPSIEDNSVGASPVGFKGLQADPNNSTLYYTGSGGVDWCYIKDFEQVGHHYRSNNDLGIFVRNSWMSPTAFNPLTGTGITCSVYHPFNPRYTGWSRGFGYNPYKNNEPNIHDAATWDATWCDDAFVVSGWNFYPALNIDFYHHTWVQNLQTMTYAQWWRDRWNDNKMPLDLFEIWPIRNCNIACAKQENRVVLKSIGSYPDEIPIGTFLTRVNVTDMTSDVFRKPLFGYKTILPEEGEFEEPQIWTMERTF